jgi:hypothetical protein
LIHLLLSLPSINPSSLFFLFAITQILTLSSFHI